MNDKRELLVELTFSLDRQTQFFFISLSFINVRKLVKNWLVFLYSLHIVSKENMKNSIIYLRIKAGTFLSKIEVSFMVCYDVNNVAHGPSLE